MSTLPTGKEGMASPNLRRRPPPRAADVTLVIGGDTVDANREALAAQSDFFRGMFSANFSEREKKEVELFDVPAPIEVVRRVVEFAELYPRCQLDIDDVDGLCGALAVADMMGIRCAVKTCCDKLHSIIELTPDTALEVYCKTELLCGDPDARSVFNLAGKTSLFRAKNWIAQDLGSVKLHHIETLLSRSDLNVSSELDVFGLIKLWVEAQSNTTGFTRLLHCIRFQQVTDNDLRKMLGDKLVSEVSRAAREMLQEVLDYREMKATKARAGSPPALVATSPASDGGPFRKLPTFPCVMSLVKDKMTVLKYDPEQNTITEVTRFLCNYDSGDAKGVKACTDGVSIFLTGGELSYGRGQWLRKAWTYNSLTDHWAVLNDVDGAEIEVESPRRHHSTCILDQKIFMVGGFGVNRIPLNTVDVLDMSSGIVSAVNKLPKAMFGVGACVFKGKIYVIKDTILVYKSEEDSWDRLGRLTVKDVAQAVADEENIYITTKSTYDLYRFSPDELVAEQDVEPECLGRFSSEAQNLCLVDGVIYNFSTEQFDYISTVETYSVRGGKFAQPWTNKGKVYDFNPNKMVFAFTPQFEPLDLGSPLWKIKSDRQAEYQLIEETIAKNDVELSALSRGSSEDPTAFMCAWERSNKTLAALLEHALTVLDVSSQTVMLLGNLIDPYSPLKVVKDVFDDVIEEELGSSFSIEVAAVGSPSPMYHWFHLASDADDWSYLSEGRMQFEDKRCKTFTRLNFEEFAPEDVGRYRCHARHSIPVLSGGASDEPFQGVYSKCVEVRVKAGSIWVKSQTQTAETFLGGPLRLEVEVISVGPVEYQWYQDGRIILNENKSSMTKMAVTAEMTGSYKCEVKGSLRTVMTKPISVSVREPNEKEAAALEFSTEEIKILKQPLYTQRNGKKAGIGDLVSLECLAVARYGLKYEWLKRGLSEDLVEISDSSEGRARSRCVNSTRLIPVSHGRSMMDRIEESSEVTSVSFWVYQCCVTCPITGERLLSNQVKVPVSSHISSARCAPSFKIALVICQDEYAEQDYFHNLNAPRRDGADLIVKLQEMDFRVLAFANLSLSELRSAVDLFSKLIDNTTHALFYFNGHALGSGDDMYLAATDSTLLPGLPIGNQLIWRGEVENQLDKCNPLLCIVIYDSCRDAAPASMEAAMKRREAITYMSSFVVAYGTRDGMKSYEYSDVNVSQGLYMKHLVRHIDTKESVSSLFESLTDSFVAEENPSITSKMKPEYKIATKQKMCLNTPIRKNGSKFTSLDRTFFNLCRFEPAVAGSASTIFNSSGGFSDQFEFEVGIVSLDDPLFEWVTGHVNESRHHGVLKLCVGPATFLNEATVSVHFTSRDRDVFEGVKFQLLGVNCYLEKVEGEIRAGHSLVGLYPPCAKKEDIKLGDGPIFDGNGNCVIKHIQAVKESMIRLRLVMWVTDSKRKDKKTSITCKGGFVGFPLPLITNFPGIRMNNLPLKNALI